MSGKIAGLRKDMQPDEIEFFETSTSALLARNSMDRIESCNSRQSSGTGVRVVKDGAIGFSFYSREKEKNEAIERAVKSARLSPREGFFLPAPTKPRKPEQFDQRVKEMGEEELVDKLLQLMEGASEGAKPSKGEVSAAWSVTRVTNSNGLDLEQEETLFSVFVSAKKGDSIGYDYSDTKNLGADALKLGKSAAEWAVRGEGGKPLEFEGPVILSVETLASFFGSCVLRNVNGENARRGKTLWKLGDRVMSEEISLADDPFKPWGAGTLGFDDEGVPTREKVLIEQGILKELVYDARSANLAKTHSTGNGFRAGFSSTPSIGFTNTVVDVPAKQRTDVFDVDKAVFVRELMGFHNMNVVTGDFALDVSNGFLVEDGELAKPVKGCMLVGNFLDALKAPAGFDRETRCRGGFYSPRMCFKARMVSK